MEYIGKTLENRYQLKKLIGSGGMANVFEAEDLEGVLGDSGPSA